MADVARLLRVAELMNIGDDVVRAARVIHVFGIGECRYAWGNPVGGFPDAWALSLEDAKRKAEDLRRAGSYWSILECSGCALVADQRSVIVVSRFQPAFRGALSAFALGPVPFPMRELAKLFQADPNWGLDLLVANETHFPPPTAKLTTYYSVAQGVGWPLSWKQSSDTEDPGGIRTPDDHLIWKRIERRSPCWLRTEAYAEAISLLRAETT